MSEDERFVLKEAFEQLVSEMHATHRAILRFDGAAFAQSVEKEVELAAGLLAHSEGETLNRNCADRLQRLLTTRRLLLCKTKRTVNALLGLLQTSRDMYEPPRIPNW